MVFLPDAPLRHVAESRGYTVTWDQESQSVTMVKGDTSYTVTLGSDICRTGDGQRSP
ncbi:MAG: stalk domain-containing protein [Oscillospiraceae bacterium]